MARQDEDVYHVAVVDGEATIVPGRDRSGYGVSHAAATVQRDGLVSRRPSDTAPSVNGTFASEMGKVRGAPSDTAPSASGTLGSEMKKGARRAQQ